MNNANYQGSASDTFVIGVAGGFSATGSMYAARYQFNATVLNNGKVLITGGGDVNDNPVAESELYDPTAGTFSVVSSTAPAGWCDATLLDNGKVLITGARTAMAIRLPPPSCITQAPIRSRQRAACTSRGRCKRQPY